jgi:hypothetical protein
MFAIDQQSLCGIISRMAILDDSYSSCAVLYSLLAWPVLVKYENPKQATKFVAAALGSLRVSMKNRIGRQEALQHILAGILICSLEVSSISYSPRRTLWLCAYDHEDASTLPVLTRLASVSIWDKENHQSVLPR